MSALDLAHVAHVFFLYVSTVHLISLRCIKLHNCIFKVCESIIKLHNIEKSRGFIHMTEMPRVRVFATIREDVEEWIQTEVESGRFRNRSHAIEYALIQLMNKEKKE